jgi:hypothetical protein
MPSTHVLCSFQNDAKSVLQSRENNFFTCTSSYGINSRTFLPSYFSAQRSANFIGLKAKYISYYLLLIFAGKVLISCHTNKILNR